MPVSKDESPPNIQTPSGSDHLISEPIEQQSVFFTICAKNYLAQAIVLADSVAAMHPGARMHVFLLDCQAPEGSATDKITFVAAEIVMPPMEWNHRQCYYDILELATSIKPACFSYLFKKGWAIAIYVDPDILFLNRINAVYSAFAEGQQIVLTPHILGPLPSDGATPSDLTILRAGLYNLGFAAFANTARTAAVLDWWDRQLHTMGLADVGQGVFTDQKWVDFIPIFEPMTRIIRDPGYNVAYWNLHERTVRRSRKTWAVTFGDGFEHDLVFYHFSGYAPGSGLLSKHENRFKRRAPGDMDSLLEVYGNLLRGAGLARFSTLPLPKPRFVVGADWDPVCRTLYRAALASDIDLGNPLSGHEFIRWAGRRKRGDHLSRYLRALLTLRHDVAVAYDDGRNAVGLTRWLHTSGGVEMGIDPRLLQQFGLASDEGVRGVNYVGYLRSHLGVAEAARGSIAALESVGVHVTTHDISEHADSPTGSYAVAAARPGAARPPQHDITILGVNADQTPSTLKTIPAQFRSEVIIGFWAWETPEFPEQWCDRFDLVDEVWVASRFCADAIQAKATVPVLVMPYAVSPPRVEPDRAWLESLRPEIGTDEFLFLFQFDVASVRFRKNPEGAVRAFTSAFSPDEPVRLIVKSLNGDRDPAFLRELADMAAGHRVTIWDEPLESLDRFRLLATADAFVSLHRAEGFGLSIAEAMAYGRPVVTTGWSGNTDFTNDTNAALVAFDLRPLSRQWGPYPAGTIWAEPRVDDAARQMRRVRDDPNWRDTIARAGARTVADAFALEVVGAAMKSRLSRLSMAKQAARLAQARAADRSAFARATIAAILGDIRRRPRFYLTRILRAPALLRSFGLRGSLRRVAEAARIGSPSDSDTNGTPSARSPSERP